MERDNYFVKYTLSSNSLDKLTAINDHTGDNDSKIKDAWRNISWETEVLEKTLTEQKHDNDNNDIQSEILSSKTNNEDAMPECTQATQYAFTQIDRTNSNYDPINSIGNITDFIYESLERTNGKLDMNLIQNITDYELSSVVNDLSKKLSHKGIYNLCHSICAMEIELSERIVRYVCKDVLLAVIISVEESSRLLNAAITECVGKFPEDIENLVFIPALNSEPKEITAILSITANLGVQQKRAYISDLCTEVKDLKLWHVTVLRDLIVPSLDENTREKLLNLLWKKSYDFSEDKNYGKMIINILKTNPPTTVQQKYLFEEIVAVHNTLFKKLIEKILNTLSIP